MRGALKGGYLKHLLGVGHAYLSAGMKGQKSSGRSPRKRETKNGYYALVHYQKICTPNTPEQATSPGGGHNDMPAAIKPRQTADSRDDSPGEGGGRTDRIPEILKGQRWSHCNGGGC